MNSRAGNGWMLEIPGGRITIGASATSRPRSRTTGANRRRSRDRCLHQVDSHSHVRNRQSEALWRTRSVHSSFNPMRRSVLSMTSTEINDDALPAAGSGADAPFTLEPRQECVPPMDGGEDLGVARMD